MDNKRFFLATLLSVFLLFAFEYFTPKKEETHNTTQQVKQEQTPLSTQKVESSSNQEVAETGPDIRVPINANQVKGSLNLRGALLDDLVLKNYRETIKKDSPLVRVLSGPKSKDANYVQTGWVNADHDTTKLPDINSVWKTDQKELTPEQPVTMTWDNGQGVKFEKTISIDKNYMFKFEQKVVNSSDKPVSVFFFGRVSRGFTPKELNGYLVHDGPIGIVDQRLEQYSYETIRKDSKAPSDISWSKNTTGGWAGITDKYWLTAIVPQQDKNVSVVYGFTPDADQSENINTGGVEKGTYQVGFTSRQPMVAAPGETVSTFGHVFSGAKVVELLNQYEKQYHIPDFWKAVDFGWFAFLTYPIFIVLDWLNNFWGNFGLALLTFTLIVKAVFYPLASKQFHSMGKMKALQPKMKEIRETYKDDQQLMNQQMMRLYKEQGVNPASGCLPILLQIPIFWCLYKDLYVTIEMRHAPFFGWIHDLSAPDPTNILNLFGLIPFDPSTISPFLHVGIWPLIFGFTMFLQQKLNPAVLDPVQKKMFQFMPFIFTVVLATQPAGLVIYYSWNNTLTALQQLVIQKRMEAKAKKASLKKAKG
ncbi:membrane protein insertase YidC [Commensalibacter papalotli (ex Botero et al. 2024)]|uniref:Membrane protein insertase YidC n=1 Tax=Commensalibacter papalotli (ex Botero et al. 2024) TaxID=2972766 RepID=A0ABM9HJM1_9PROT|nr:membrane protein insertase YidC [Commensalibacter papalotli (ex Botero et al. 2024)]CAI3925007.1 Membrane protein insertase Oxa1/YidC/SpoIIIJ (YidC) (PDB:3WO6) [Commensalibacter papalotli (ex Botero et al. 2024)]CAI3927032.1 Membrane protein insertase Oxa1/YidC/SpoIIIJ (YidC) (PDB:3WO6) [Commensalibacter papalotli (ex Botero et al. 2024)]